MIIIIYTAFSFSLSFLSHTVISAFFRLESNESAVGEKMQLTPVLWMIEKNNKIKFVYIYIYML
jgi:hypothetical protein